MAAAVQILCVKKKKNRERARKKMTVKRNLLASMCLEEMQVKQVKGFICFQETGICDPLLSIHQSTRSYTCYVSRRNFPFNQSTELKVLRHDERLLSISTIYIHFLLCAVFQGIQKARQS